MTPMMNTEETPALTRTISPPSQDEGGAREGPLTGGSGGPTARRADALHDSAIRRLRGFLDDSGRPASAGVADADGDTARIVAADGRVDEFERRRREPLGRPAAAIRADAGAVSRARRPADGAPL